MWQLTSEYLKLGWILNCTLTHFRLPSHLRKASGPMDGGETCIFSFEEKTGKCCAVAVSIWVVLLSRPICSCQHVLLQNTIIVIIMIIIIVTSIIIIIIIGLLCFLTMLPMVNIYLFAATHVTFLFFRRFFLKTTRPLNWTTVAIKAWSRIRCLFHVFVQRYKNIIMPSFSYWY